MVVVVPEVHDTEDLGGFGILYHDHVALGVLGLYSHAQVIARLVFVSHLQRCLHRSLLLTSPVTTQLQRIVGIESPGSQVSGAAYASEDSPHVGHPIVAPKSQGYPYRVVHGVGLRLRSVGWQALPPASLFGTSQGTTQELNPSGCPVIPRVPCCQVVLVECVREDPHVGELAGMKWR